MTCDYCGLPSFTRECSACEASRKQADADERAYWEKLAEVRRLADQVEVEMLGTDLSRAEVLVEATRRLIAAVRGLAR